MINLNKQQELAVDHPDGIPAVVTAIPGSGKTATLIERCIHLINNGVMEDEILMITFTNKAAKTISSRISNRLNKDKVKCYISTFHSLSATLLRIFCDKVPISSSYTIIDDSDQETLIKKIINE
jgi:DNA helicase-2/ATP-dependent DNA helicase PcrA